MLELGDEAVSQVNMKVVGIGGAGVNTLDRIFHSGLRGVELVAINTDAQDLRSSSVPLKIQIGSEITKGLGCGSDPELGRRSANEDRKEILEAISGADLLFITAGLGGGTGTGASPVVAELAREEGAIVVAVVTKPFPFEGRRRALQAELGAKELISKVDTLISIPNQRLFQLVEKGVSLVDAFKAADDMLLRGVEVISNLIATPGLINLDFADVKAVIAKAGGAHLGIGVGKGENRAHEAAQGAIYSPLLEGDLKGAKGILINIAGGVDLTLEEMKKVATTICELADPEANIIFGASIDEELKGELKVTLLATGIETLRLDEPLISHQGSPVGLGKFMEDSPMESELDIPTFLRRMREKKSWNGAS